MSLEMAVSLVFVVGSVFGSILWQLVIRKKDPKCWICNAELRAPLIFCPKCGSPPHSTGIKGFKILEKRYEGAMDRYYIKYSYGGKLRVALVDAHRLESATEQEIPVILGEEANRFTRDIKGLGAGGRSVITVSNF